MSEMIDWTPELVDRICGAIAQGDAISDIAGKSGVPAECSIYRHMAADTDFASRIARAREAQQDYEADRCIKLADAATVEDWQVVKMRIWARQWRAAKLAPKKYGEKLDIEHSGKIETRSDEQLNAQIAALVGKRGPNDADEKREAGTDNAS